jgi:hypothetical protein
MRNGRAPDYVEHLRKFFGYRFVALCRSQEAQQWRDRCLALELHQGAPSVQRGPGLAAIRVAVVQRPITGQSGQLSNMLATESELHRIIKPFSRIITSSFANGQQSLDRTCVICTKIVTQHRFYHPIPQSHGNIGPAQAGRRTPQCTERPAVSWRFELLVTFRFQ